MDKFNQALNDLEFAIERSANPNCEETAIAELCVRTLKEKLMSMYSDALEGTRHVE